VYVQANQAAAAEPEFERKCKKTAELLEGGDIRTTAMWAKFRALSLECYNQAGDRFDRVSNHWYLVCSART
jgi:arginyl-tRNA synthetase